MDPGNGNWIHVSKGTRWVVLEDGGRVGSVELQRGRDRISLALPPPPCNAAFGSQAPFRYMYPAANGTPKVTPKDLGNVARVRFQVNWTPRRQHLHWFNEPGESLTIAVSLQPQ